MISHMTLEIDPDGDAAPIYAEVPVQQDEHIPAAEIVKAAPFAPRKPRKRAPRATPDADIEAKLEETLKKLDAALDEAEQQETAAETPGAKKKRVAKPKKKAKAPAKKKAAKKAPKSRARNTARALDRAKQQAANAGQRRSKRAKRRSPNAVATPLKRGPKGNPPSKVKRTGDAVFGAKVARKRIYLGFTQGELGKKVGILQPHMCNVEKGTLMPSPELRARINAVLFDKQTDPKALKHRRSTK